jgi:cysteine synthase
MDVFSSLIDVIGNTPIVEVFSNHFSLYAKLEYLNPGGSIKDRTALHMIRQAEKKGLLKSGGTIIEASSGNQGAAAAMIGNILGYNVIITMSEKVSVEKQAVFKAYGAQLVLCQSGTGFSDCNHYYQVAKKLAQDIPGSYFLNQYFNEENAEAHFFGIAPEINRQMGKKLTHIVVAMGSAGTAYGIARYMKTYRPDVKVIGVDAATSYKATHGNPRPYCLDGMGIDYDSPFFDLSLFDQIVTVTDEEVHCVLKKLAREYGFLVGPSSGGGFAAIQKIKDNFQRTDGVLTLFPDSGRAYLSKKYYE